MRLFFIVFLLSLLCSCMPSSKEYQDGNIICTAVSRTSLNIDVLVTLISSRNIHDFTIINIPTELRYTHSGFGVTFAYVSKDVQFRIINPDCVFKGNGVFRNLIVEGDE